MAQDQNLEIRKTVQARVRHELVLRSPAAAIAYFVAGVVLFLQHLGSLNYIEFMIPLGVVVALSSVARYFLAKQILNDPKKYSHLVGLHAQSIMVNAISWCIAFGLITYESFYGDVSLLFPMIVLSAFSAGAITSLSAVPWVIGSFTLLTNGAPTSVVLVGLIQGKTTWQTGVFILPIIMQAVYVLIQGKQVRTGLIKRYEAEELLRREKIELEETNESLRKTRRDLDIQTAKAQNSAKFAALGTMAGGVAHEINNPLAMIVGHASHILERHEGKTEDINQFTIQKAQKVYKAAQRIATITKGLRTFSREAEADPFVLSNIASVVEETLGFCRERFRQMGIHLEVDVDPSIEVECRPVQISQVLLNLLNNATDAVEMAATKRIVIRAGVNGDILNLSVEDSGSGVPPELSERIFEPFFTTKEVGKGTGLGLSISKSMVEEHHGELVLSNRSPTCFELRIPLRQKSSSTHAAA